MLPNGFVEITCVKPDFRYSWRKNCGFGRSPKFANEVLSSLARDCFLAYGTHPYITSQVIDDGTFETHSCFITFPKPSDTRYIVRFLALNDLPF